MNKISPTLIKRADESNILIEWIDGYSKIIALKNIREECPCAKCESYRNSGNDKVLAWFKKDRRGKYELQNIDKVGNYAIRFVWKDRHDTGIYTWEVLRKICEKHFE